MRSVRHWHRDRQLVCNFVRIFAPCYARNITPDDTDTVPSMSMCFTYVGTLLVLIPGRISYEYSEFEISLSMDDLLLKLTMKTNLIMILSV